MERKRTDTIPHYDPMALKRNIEKCGENIRIFQDAINKELENKVKLQYLLDEVEAGDGNQS